MSRNSPKMTNKTASDFLNRSDQQGAHNRSEHVGKTGQQLTNRNKPTATSYLSKADQNMGAKSFLNSPTGKNLKADTGSGPRGTKLADSAPQGGGRLSPIAKVALQKPGGTDVFNAKVTSNRMVMVKNSQGVKAQSTFPDGGVPLPKPKSGPNLKPSSPLSVPGPTGVRDPRKGVVNLAKNANAFGKAVNNAKANLRDVSASTPQGGMNAGNPVALANAKKALRSVEPPTPKPIDHGNRKQFKSITKGVKK